MGKGCRAGAVRSAIVSGGAVQVNNSKGLIESLNIAWLRELLNGTFEDKFRTSGCGCGVSASTCELERSGSSVVL